MNKINVLSQISFYFHVVGCSPPPPPVNGRISEHNSGGVGAMLTFQCDTGYMPQEGGVSTCKSNTSWIPRPECEGIISNKQTNLYVKIKTYNHHSD